MYPVNFVIPGVSIDSYPGYSINYCFISCNCFLATIFLIGFDVYIILLSLHLASRFELCGCYFESVGKSDIDQLEFIKNGINLHSETLELYNLCQNIMEPIVFIQMSSIIVKICCEMIIVLVNPFNQGYMTFLASIAQLFCYCVCGEIVSTKASAVATKVCDSMWYNLKDTETKKLLITVIHRSQKNCFFAIANYSPLTMETFAKILSITFKSFNFVRHILH
uniref:CSON001378 protein n=1 Tax=Culicoides sonorensis TaxID=179676 RepID=A0A336KY39_CULSO